MTLSPARSDVRDDGLVGVLYHPENCGPLPGVLLLGGSEGGLHERHASLLATEGFAVLALAYYGMSGLPQVLRDIPLEYFAAALEYLRRHPAVDARRIGVLGGSKGGEAALLIASMFPGIRAVVCLAGSGVVTQGISQSVFTGSLREILTTPVASWTYQDREIPYLPNVMTDRMEAALDACEPVALGWAKPDLASELLGHATIPVERIDGAVLLIVGQDDRNYGVPFHDIAAQRLDRYNHPHAWTHIVHPGAGHLIIAPPDGRPTPSTGPGPGVTFLHGGTPRANARARDETWRETLAFLRRELK